jgi:sodium/pantothenate symporter
MGGLECTFLLPIVGGLFWKKANTTGVLLSIFGSLAVYIYMKAAAVSILGMDAVVISVAVSAVLFIVGSLFGRKPSKEVLNLYYS